MTEPAKNRVRKLRFVRQKGFTLIELMIVITIIAVLAGLTAAIATAVQNRARRAKAEALIKAVDAGLERYYTDNGDYPWPSNEDETGEVNDMNTKIGPARCLYQALSGDGDDSIVGGTEGSDGETEDPEVAYWEDIVAPRDRKGVPVYTDDGDYILTDPWNHPWQYEIFDQEESDEYNQNTNNMTYDLWSFASDESAGKNEELRPKWVTNW